MLHPNNVVQKMQYNVLLIEDTESDADALAVQLEHDRRAEYSIERTRTLEEALKKISEQGYDAILMDWTLPDSTGIDSIQRLRAKTGASVIVLTEEADENLGLQVIKHGAQDFLQKKKYEEFEVAKAIQYAIERQAIQRQVEFLAYHDSLTSLPNRNLFFDRLSQTLADCERTGKSFAIHAMDLDGFKELNDTYGHAAGDDALIHVARRLLGVIRAKDTVARFGGDEFILLQTDVAKMSHAEIVANRLFNSMVEPMDIHGKSVNLGITVGVSIYPDHGTDVETLLKKADQAMYEGKEKGKNCVCFYQPDE